MRTQIICLVIVLLCSTASGQWVHTHIPNSIPARCFAVSGTNLFAGANSGVLLSTNQGTSWTAVNNGLTDTSIWALAVSGTNLFAGSGPGALFYKHGRGVFLSTNNGASWTAVNTGLTDTTVYALAVSGTNVYAGTDSGVFLSTNSGTVWSAVKNGLPSNTVRAFAVSGNNVFAGTWGDGVFLSTNNGSSWAQIDSGLPDSLFVYCFAVSGTNLFAGTDANGLFLSTNNGTSWNAANGSIGNRLDKVTLGGIYVKSLAVSGANVFCGIGLGVFLSSNNGASWKAFNTGLSDTTIWALAVSGTNLFAATSNEVWRRPLSEMITSAGLASADLPARFTLEQNYPNPFNPSTTIKYELPRISLVSLTVYDVLGRVVSVLVNARNDAGIHEVKFEGSNLASGVYFYRLQAGDYIATKKLLLMK